MSYSPVLNSVLRFSGALDTDESSFRIESAVKSGKTSRARDASVIFPLELSLTHFVSNFFLKRKFRLAFALSRICIERGC